MTKTRAEGEAEAVVAIKVEGKGSPDYHLRISLTNRSRKPLTTYRHALPWVGHSSIILIAAKTDAGGTTLAANAPIDDPGPDTVVIGPGETMSGTISMENRFAGFLEALKKRDVVAFWSYAFQPVDVAPLDRTGGCVIYRGIS